MKKNHTVKLWQYVLSFVMQLSFHLTTLTTCDSTDAPSDKILLNCGSLGASQFNGGKWIDDTGSNFLPPAYDERSSELLLSNLNSEIPEIPYSTARVIHSSLMYSFPLSHGLIFIRFYFLSNSYLGLNPSKSYFSVKVGPYTLLSNFSPSIAAEELKLVYFTKDFLVNVNTKRVNITFTPSPLISNAFAFVNGIEIFSVPLSIYFPGPKIPIPFLGHQVPFFINDEYALEVLYRVSVSRYSRNGVKNVFGTWVEDLSYISGFKDGSILDIKGHTTDLTYNSSRPDDYLYAAPQELYWTARTMGSQENINMRYNLTWSFPVDSDFKYLIRLHFCEISTDVTQVNQRVFKVYINNQTAEESMDLVALTGAPLITLYRDYVVMVPVSMESERKQKIRIALHPNMKSKPKYADAIMNGVEIIKLSDNSHNLAARIQLKMEQKEKKTTYIIIVGSTLGAALGLLITFFILVPRIGKRLKWGKFWMLPSNAAGKSLQLRVSSGQCYQFTLAEIRTATSNFNQALVIGEGGFGKVYKGFIHDGVTTVAIKRCNPTSHQGYREFQNEINLLSSFHHMNLLLLLGYCQDNNELILVYEYMAEGTLRDHLYKTKKQPLTWNQRLDICIAAARGLHYLHTGTRHPVIHRDVKSANILLDHNMVAKIADFGLSRIGPTSTSGSHVSTDVKGTFGYLDPEYYRRRKLTEKSDVYSFGVVLFEVLCGRPAVKPMAVEEDGEKIGLVEWARQCYLSGTFHRMVDPHLQVGVPSNCLEAFVDIGIKCLADKSTERPTMGEVLSNLEKLLLMQESMDAQETNGDLSVLTRVNERTKGIRIIDET